MDATASQEALITRDEENALERYKEMGTPKRRRLRRGESVPVPGYEFLNVQVSGPALEFLEFPNGEVAPVIPNARGLAKAVFCLVVINRRVAFTHRHLRYVRRHLGLTQQKLADIIGLQRQSVVEFENNHRAFDKSVELAVRLIALPTALNYLPEKLRHELREPLQAIQEFYAHLDELSIPVLAAGKALKSSRKSFIVSVKPDFEDCAA